MNYLPSGWTEGYPGGIATNPDPIQGGIVDKEIVSGKWFLIFNHSDKIAVDGYATREDAFKDWYDEIHGK